MATIEQIRFVAYIGRMFGLKMPVRPVCCGHASPAQIVAEMVFDQPGLLLIHGARGVGKSLSAAEGLVLRNALFQNRRADAAILGGSLAQSAQIYNALKIFRDARPEAPIIEELQKQSGKFQNGGTVEILAASEKSVRGPHKPWVFLDEVDEIDPEIRESAMGMVVAVEGVRSSVVMTSTWHRIAGPMADLVKRGQAGEFPVRTLCMFDVLERCPTERSGPNLENCPDCPLVRWCHSDIAETGLPKAKRSDGHYSIDTLCQKTRSVSARVFESDYLSMEPRPSGMWFTAYDEAIHVSESAEYRRGEPVHLAIDPGLHTGAVWFQIRRRLDGTADVNVFGDYYADSLPGGAGSHAVAISQRNHELTGLSTRSHLVSMDSAGWKGNEIGPTVFEEYRRNGCIGRNMEIVRWPAIGPGRPKADTLATLEALLLAADGRVSIKIHPRCEHLRSAMKSYLRARTPSGQFLDRPVEHCHPEEELIDSLTGGLVVELPEGLKAPNPDIRQVPARRIM